MSPAPATPAPDPVAPPGAGRWDAVAVGVTMGLVYAVTCCPSVPPGDGGELLTCAWTLGVPHPPGYPLYTLTGWLWAHLLPLGAVPFRLNLFSAATMAAAVGFALAAARRAGASRPAAALGALALGCAAEPWRAAVGAEVFAMHALFVALLGWLALRWPSTGRPPYLEAFVLGLAASHHQTVALLVPALVAWAWVHRDRFGPEPSGPVMGCAGLMALGLLPYALLLYTGTREGALVWGGTTTVFNQAPAVLDAQQRPIPGLAEGLVNHVLRAAYGGKLGSMEGGAVDTGYAGGLWLGLKWAGVWVGLGCGGLWLAAWALAPLALVERGRRVGAALMPALWLAGGGFVGGLLCMAVGRGSVTLLGLAVMGAWFAWALHRLAADAGRDPRWLLALAVAVSGPAFLISGANFAVGDPLRRAVVARFTLMPAIPLAVLAALGVDVLRERFGTRMAHLAGAVAVAVALVASLGWLGGAPAGLAGVRCFEANGRHLLASAPPGSVVFVRGDVPTNAVNVLQYCLGERPDVRVVNQQKLNYPWGARQARRHGVAVPGLRYDGLEVRALNLIDANIAARRVFFYGIDPRDQAPGPDRRPVPSYQLRYRLVPRGLLEEAVPLTRELDLAAIGEAGLALLESFDWPAVVEAPGDPYFVHEVQDLHAAAYQSLGAFLHTGTKPGKADWQPALARRAYEAGLARFPNYPTLWRSYGLLLAQTGDKQAARPYLERYLASNPQDPDAAALAQAVDLPWNRR